MAFSPTLENLDYTGNLDEALVIFGTPNTDGTQIVPLDSPKYEEADYNHSLYLDAATGLVGATSYSADISVDGGGAQTVTVLGSNAPTVKELLAQINGRAEVTDVTLPAASTFSTGGAGDYWTLQSATPTSYYVWYNVDGGNSDPAPGGTGIEVDVSAADLATDIARATSAAIGALADFDTTYHGNVVRVTNTAVGVATDAADGSSSGATFDIVAQGTDNQLTGAVIALVDGNLRVTSDEGEYGTIDIQNAGTPLFPAITGWVDYTRAKQLVPWDSLTDAEQALLGGLLAEHGTPTAEVTDVTTPAASTFAHSGPASYWTLNAANDATQYYVWYNITDAGTEVDPAPAGLTSLVVAVLDADTAAQVATKTAAAINALGDFSSPAPGGTTLTVTNAATGSTTDAADVTAGVTVQVTTQGGEQAPITAYEGYQVANLGGGLTGGTNTNLVGDADTAGVGTVDVGGSVAGGDPLTLGNEVTQITTIADAASLDKVWQVDVAPTLTFVDQTANANSATDADWEIFPTTEGVGDYVAFGMSETFQGLVLDNANGTAGTVGVVVWEYWDGSAWSSLETGNFADGTSDFTAAAADGQVVVWDIPSDWERTALNGSDLYYVRARITTVYTVNPVYDQGFSSILGGHYFFINSTTTEYYFWMNTASAGADPGGAGGPLFGLGLTGVAVTLSGGETAAQVATAVDTALDGLSGGTVFTSTANSNVLSVLHDVAGPVTDASAQNSGFSITVTQQGLDLGTATVFDIFTVADDDGSLDNKYFLFNSPTDGYYLWFNSGAAVAQVVTVTAHADVSGSLNNTYFFISSPTTDYYVWFNVNSAGTDPAISGRTGVEVTLATDAANTVVGDAIGAALDALADFSATQPSDGTTVVTNAATGDANDPSGGTAEVTTVITSAASTLAQSGAGDYFRLNSLTDGYYVWYNVAAGNSDPAPAQTLGQVWQVDVNTGPTFVDETTDANSAGVGDWDIFPTVEEVGDYVAIGFATPFSSVVFDNTGGTAGTVGVVTWEYWDGRTSSWTALPSIVDGTTGFTAAAGSGQTVSWAAPTGWAAMSLNGSASLYYIRARVTTVYTVNPVYDSAFITLTGVSVAVAAADDAVTVATKTAAAVDAIGDFNAASTGGTVTITGAEVGNAENAADFNTGFTVAPTTDGTSFGTGFTFVVNTQGEDLGVDPNITGRTAVPVSLTYNSSAATIATAVQTAINGLTDFSASVSGNDVTVTNALVGETANPRDGNGTGFTFTVELTGGIGNDASGQTVRATVRVDGGDLQTIEISVGNVTDYTSLVAAINAQLTGATASVGTGDIVITSGTTGFGSSVEIVDYNLFHRLQEFVDITSTPGTWAVTYEFTVDVDGTPIAVSFLGSAAATYTTLLAAINTDLGANATASLDGSGNLRITSATLPTAYGDVSTVDMHHTASPESAIRKDLWRSLVDANGVGLFEGFQTPKSGALDTREAMNVTFATGRQSFAQMFSAKTKRVPTRPAGSLGFGREVYTYDGGATFRHLTDGSVV